MDEFQMCFPRVGEDVSISGRWKAGAGGADEEGWEGCGKRGGITLHTAPLGMKSLRCPLLQFPFDYLTSNWLRYSDSLLAVSNIFSFFCTKHSRYPSVIHNIYRQSHAPERGCSCRQSFPNHFAQLQNCIFEPRR